MLSGIFAGMIASGVYYLAYLHRDHLQQKKFENELLSETIRNDLENCYKSIFPKISRKFPNIQGIGNDQIKQLKELFFRSDGELEDQLRKAIAESLYGLFSSEYICGEPFVGMFSIEGLKRVLLELRQKKNLLSIEADTISIAVPTILFQMLQEISANPSLSSVFEIVLECQKAKFRNEVIKNLSDIKKNYELDDETILNTINITRQKLRAEATRRYDIKIAGRELNMYDHFEYIPPRMHLIVKDDNKIPSQIKNNTRPIDSESLLKLFLEKKKIFILSDAGVGKTSFIYRMQLDLLISKINETPLPIYETVNDFIRDSGALFDRLIFRIQSASAIDFSPEKASKIAGMLNESGRLCFLLDSLDQCSDEQGYKNVFQMDSAGIISNNRVIITCRTEYIKRDPEKYRDMFSSYEWVFLDRFSDEQSLKYLGPNIINWLEYQKLSENFKELLKIPFYANITKRIRLQPNSEQRRVKTRGQLLREFEAGLFREAEDRGIKFHKLDEYRIKKLIYRLSLETLTENHIQTFPRDFINRYFKDFQNECKIVFDSHWVFFNKTLFEGRDASICTFYHQLLQEFFAARRLEQLFDENPEKFDESLIKLPFSIALLDLLDNLLLDEPTLDHCMKRFEEALDLSDRNREGVEGKGHLFTWLLALRDRKGEKPELKQKLQKIFDEEKKMTREDAEMRGNFVLIPAGSFLMGGNEKTREQPVRIVYLTDYWISIYAETCTANWDTAEKLAMFKGKDYCLPTEAQWEKAARGRLGRKYPWGNFEPDKNICNFDLLYGKPVEVNKFEPQMYGIYQMAGNLFEWCKDYYGEYQNGKINDPIGPDTGSRRVIRGGGWRSHPWDCRCAARSEINPKLGSPVNGFRLVMQIGQ